MIKAILACDDEWGIGKDGDLPWPHNPADLKWFKKNTINCCLLYTSPSPRDRQKSRMPSSA